MSVDGPSLLVLMLALFLWVRLIQIVNQWELHAKFALREGCSFASAAVIDN